MDEGIARAPSAGVEVRVATEPIHISECESLAAPSDGALVVFCGVVRGKTEGRLVEGLQYEAYSRMAEQQMREIGILAQTQFGASSVLLVHRTGDLKVGEVSVMAAVSAPHREAAFLACRFCIDTVKEEAAIWKKEFFSEGGSHWVNGA